MIKILFNCRSKLDVAAASVIASVITLVIAMLGFQFWSAALVMGLLVCGYMSTGIKPIKPMVEQKAREVLLCKGVGVEINLLKNALTSRLTNDLPDQNPRSVKAKVDHIDPREGGSIWVRVQGKLTELDMAQVNRIA